MVGQIRQRQGDPLPKLLTLLGIELLSTRQRLLDLLEAVTELRLRVLKGLRTRKRLLISVGLVVVHGASTASKDVGESIRTPSFHLFPRGRCPLLHALTSRRRVHLRLCPRLRIRGTRSVLVCPYDVDAHGGECPKGGDQHQRVRFHDPRLPALSRPLWARTVRPL